VLHHQAAAGLPKQMLQIGSSCRSWLKIWCTDYPQRVSIVKVMRRRLKTMAARIGTGVMLKVVAGPSPQKIGA